MFSFLQIREDGCFSSRQGGKKTPGMATDYLYMVACWGFPCSCQYVEPYIHWSST